MTRFQAARKTAFLATTALILASAAPAMADDCNKTKTANYSPTEAAVMGATIQNASMKSDHGTIIDAAVGTPQLSTLTAAVTAAGLVETLQGDGPFTVFAPTNSAFAKLPAGTVETLLKPENKPILTNILTSHVVAGNLSATDIIAKVKAEGGMTYVKTLSGEKLKVKLKGDRVMIKDANGNKSFVTTADIMKSNGTVHVIDNVILPKADHTA